MAGGVLIVWTDIAPDLETDFNDWYNREHLPDRVGRMPGFLRGRRYAAVDGALGAPRFLTYYDLTSTAVMQSEAHVALRKNRRERDHFFLPRFQNTIKAICDVACRVGEADGELLALLPVRADAGREDAFAHHLARTLLPALAVERGVVSALYARANVDITRASSAKDDRAGDRYADGLIAVQIANEAGAAAALRALRRDALARAGGAPQFIEQPCVLRLMFELRAA